MSSRLDAQLALASTRPTRPGTRRRPRARDLEQVRPAPVYRAALSVSFARMAVIDRLREQGFSR